MKIKLVYIDDEDEDLKIYQRIFKDNEKANNLFEINTLNSQKKIDDLVNEIKTENPELILVDYRLDKPKNGVILGVSGAALSTALREVFSEIPIVLFTKIDFLGIEKFNPKILSNSDETIYKSDIIKEDEKYFEILYKLAIGYKKLRISESKYWLDLLKLIGAPENDLDYLKLAEPPSISESGWSAFDVTFWIRKTLLKYPGILYDPIHSATFLGISVDDFLSNSVHEVFSAAKYSGIFAPEEGRWWKSRLQEIAESIMDESEIDLIIREGFPKAWEIKNDSKIERSKCVFCNKSPAEWVCYILNKPVMIECSLRYKPDTRPLVMNEARVSFEAIQTSNDVDDNNFDPIEFEMLADIREM